MLLIFWKKKCLNNERIRQRSSGTCHIVGQLPQTIKRDGNNLPANSVKLILFLLVRV